VISIDVSWHLRRSWRAAALLRRVARGAAAAEGFVSGQLSIAVVGVKAMGNLHRRFAGMPGATDVLAFDLGSEPDGGHLDAEVVLCANFAWRAAKGRLPAARRELALYLVHGLLHLAGYEDGTPAGFERMHAQEDQLLTKLGLGPVFHPQASVDGRRPSTTGGQRRKRIAHAKAQRR
jgi:probable rRNA maturation factor